MLNSYGHNKIHPHSKNLNSYSYESTYLNILTPKKPFYLQTDALDVAVGGHLFQIKDNGEKAVILFPSRKLQLVEHRFITIEKELLALAFCLKS